MTHFAEGSSGETWEIRVAGEMDVARADEFLELARAGLGRCEHLRLDLAAVTFMDSSGLGVLLQIRREAADTGKLLTLRSLGPGTHRLLEVAGLKQLFEIEPDPST